MRKLLIVNSLKKVGKKYINKTNLVNMGKGHIVYLVPNICLKLFTRPKLNPFLSTLPFSKTGALKASAKKDFQI